jgi:hypothetical protein
MRIFPAFILFQLSAQTRFAGVSPAAGLGA